MFCHPFWKHKVPQTCTPAATHRSKSIHVKVSYPKKQREAVQMTAPFRTSGRLKRASLVTLGSSGFPLRSVLVYSDTDPHIMYPKRGANTPVISEHHKKHTSGSLERIKPCLTCGSKQRIAAIGDEGKSSLCYGTAGVRSLTLSFTVEMKQLGCFYARPPCVLRPGGVFVRVFRDWTAPPPIHRLCRDYMGVECVCVEVFSR